MKCVIWSVLSGFSGVSNPDTRNTSFGDARDDFVNSIRPSERGWNDATAPFCVRAIGSSTLTAASEDDGVAGTLLMNNLTRAASPAEKIILSPEGENCTSAF